MTAQEATIKLSPQSTERQTPVFSGFGNNTAGARGGGAGGPEQPVPPRGAPPPRPLAHRQSQRSLAGCGGAWCGAAAQQGPESLLFTLSRGTLVLRKPRREHEAARLEAGGEAQQLFPHFRPQASQQLWVTPDPGV